MAINQYTQPAQTMPVESQFVSQAQGYTPIPFQQLMAAGNVLEGRADRFNEAESAFRDLMGSTIGIDQYNPSLLPGSEAVNLGQAKELSDIRQQYEDEFSQFTEGVEPWKLGQMGKLRGLMNRYKKDMQTGRIADIAYNTDVIKQYEKVRSEADQLQTNPELGLALDQQFRKEAKEIQDGTRTRFSLPSKIGDAVDINKESASYIGKMKKTEVGTDSKGNPIMGRTAEDVAAAMNSFIDSTPHVRGAIAQQAKYLSSTTGIDPEQAYQFTKAQYLDNAINTFSYTQPGRVAGTGTGKSDDAPLGIGATINIPGQSFGFKSSDEARESIKNDEDALKTAKYNRDQAIGNYTTREEDGKTRYYDADGIDRTNFVNTEFIQPAKSLETRIKRDKTYLDQMLPYTREDISAMTEEERKQLPYHEEAMKIVNRRGMIPKSLAVSSLLSPTSSVLGASGVALPSASDYIPYFSYESAYEAAQEDAMVAHGEGTNFATKFNTVTDDDTREAIDEVVSLSVADGDVSASLFEILEDNQRVTNYDQKDLEGYNLSFGSKDALKPKLVGTGIDSDGSTKSMYRIYNTEEGKQNEYKTILIPMPEDFETSLESKGVNMEPARVKRNLTADGGILDPLRVPTVTEPVVDNLPLTDPSSGKQITAKVTKSKAPTTGRIIYQLDYYMDGKLQHETDMGEQQFLNRYIQLKNSIKQ